MQAKTYYKKDDVKKKKYSLLHMLDVQNNSLMIITITIIGSWRKNKMTLSNSNLGRKWVFLNNQKLLSEAILSLWNWCKSHAVTYSFCSVPKRLGEVFFHTYSQPCSIPFVLCGISTKGLESRLEKSAAGSPWEKGSPAAAVPAQPPVPHQQLAPPLQHTGLTKVTMLAVLLTWGWDSPDPKDCSWWGAAKHPPSSSESGTKRSLLSISLDVRILHAPTSHRFIQEFFLVELINSHKARLYPCT